MGNYKGKSFLLSRLKLGSNPPNFTGRVIMKIEEDFFNGKLVGG